MMRRARPLLGTYVDIEATGLSAAALDSAVNMAFGAVAKVHHLMSFHDPASDVSRLNPPRQSRARHGGPLDICGVVARADAFSPDRRSVRLCGRSRIDA
jgi:thiamine biosynthesis lipoprotein ApbE